jgi:hypothetical protein
MLRTRLRCKQPKKRVVDDEIGLSGQKEGKRREAAEARSRAGEGCDGVERGGEGMFGDGEGGGGAQARELPHVAL